MTHTANPASFVVTFAAAPVKFTPQRLREACDARDAVSLAGLLPATISPTAALGRAVLNPGAAGKDHRWVHVGQSEGVSRWIYCASSVTSSSAMIAGNAGANATNATGLLVVDAGVPLAVAVALRAAYEHERGVVDPAKVTAAVSRLVTAASRKGVQLLPGVVLLPAVDDQVEAALRVLSDLGGVGLSYALSDVDAVRLAVPAQRSLDEDVAELVEQVQELSARAASCATDEAAPDVRKGSADTVRAKLTDARARLALWRDRLGLGVARAEAALSSSETAMDTAVDAALQALEARRQARRASAA